ncbi:MAG: nicotinamide mononucleotide transporter [Bacilli bacterium]|nr:nicotinamide mononucleotide transporter [Bacilli bacterium]
MNIKELLKNELKGWKLAEVLWLLVACLVILALSIYWQDTFMGIVSALTGVACVICTGKGKLSAYLFGLINCVLYAIISYKAKLYGETMLNALYYVPMQFIGFYIWSKNMNKETNEVNKIHMTNKVRIFWLAIMIIATIGYGFILKLMGDAMPFVDSFTTVSSVVAMIVSVKMYSEQWWIWIAVDVFTVYMWLVNFIQGSENMATLLMWVVYLANAIIMCVKWEKEAINNSKNANIKKEVMANEI